MDVIAEWANGEDGTPRGFREHLVTAFRRVADSENEACEDQLRQYMPDTRQMQNLADAIAARRKNRSAT